MTTGEITTVIEMQPNSGGTGTTGIYIEILKDVIDGTIKIGDGSGTFLEGYISTEHDKFTRLAYQSNYGKANGNLCEMFDPSCLSKQNACSNLVILFHVFIEPEFRGNDYGIDAMNQIIQYYKENFPGTTIIIFPAGFGTSSEFVAKKLQKYWACCGFLQCKETMCFYKECDVT